MLIEEIIRSPMRRAWITKVARSAHIFETVVYVLLIVRSLTTSRKSLIDLKFDSMYQVREIRSIINEERT